MAFLPKVVLVGRPNVGKSTLFNRLVGRRLAIVHDQPGVTRDRREESVVFFGLQFTAIDTAGLIDPQETSLTQLIISQTQTAIEEADVILFIIDGREGLTSADEMLAKTLRRANKPVLVIVNKCEGSRDFPGMADAFSLGFTGVVPLSAEHGEGVTDLYQALLPHIKDCNAPQKEGKEAESPLQLAIVGRPNVGKSTLVNAFLQEDRFLVADQPGVTRDAIGVDWVYQGRAIHLIDTAGLRRRSKVHEPVEFIAGAQTQQAIRYAQAVILLIDAQQPMEKQDMTIAQHIIEEGRILVIGINKIDKVPNPQSLMTELQARLEKELAQAPGILCISLSALSGKNCHRLLDAVLKMDVLWNTRLPTAALNRWLMDVTQQHPPPMVQGRRIRLKYMTQARARPPSFILFSTKATELPDHYTRYLLNRLRQDFQLPGIPLRLWVRAQKNPYAE